MTLFVLYVANLVSEFLAPLCTKERNEAATVGANAASNVEKIAMLEEKLKAHEELMRRISELDRVEAANLEPKRCKAVEAKLASTRTHVEEANRRNERLKAEYGVACEDLLSVERLADERSDYITTLANERNQAKSELEQLHLKRSMMNIEIFDTATLISSPTDFGNLRCLFKRSFNELRFHDSVSHMIYNVDSYLWIRRCIKHLPIIYISGTTLLGYDCPPNNKETTSKYYWKQLS